MEFDVSPDRPLARLLVDAITSQAPIRSAWRGPYVPPVVDSAEDGAVPAASFALETAAEMLTAMLLGVCPETLAHQMCPDIVAWSPTVFATNRDDVMAGFLAHEFRGNTLTDVTVELLTADAALPRVYLEWRLVGRFTNPCFVDDDLLVKPTGRLVETCGAAVVTFAGDHVRAIHCYFDDLALLEQLVTTP